MDLKTLMDLRTYTMMANEIKKGIDKRKQDANEALSTLKHLLHERDDAYISFQNYSQVLEQEIADGQLNPLNLFETKQEQDRRHRQIMLTADQDIQYYTRYYEELRRDSETFSGILFTTLASQFLEESSSEPKQTVLKQAKTLIDKIDQDANEVFSDLKDLLRVRDKANISCQNCSRAFEEEMARDHLDVRHNPLNLLARKQVQEKGFREAMSTVAQGIQNSIRIYEEKMRESDALSEMLFTTFASQFLAKSSSEPEETLVSPIFHTSVLVDPTPSSANLPAQVPQSISQIHGRSDSTSMSSFLLRPSPEPDPSGNNIQSFSLPVQNFDETDSQLSPAALFHLSPPKPPPDPSHQADNIPRLKCSVLNTREPPDPLSIRYDLSANFPRLKCCNTREPLHLRLTPTPVLTSLRLAPVPPRPPSTALT